MTNTRKGRFRFFVGAVILFLITAPLSLLYTAGYRWDSETGLTKTGTFLFETTPRDATVTLDGELLKDKTPSIVKRVSPGLHTVRFELEGHETWEKTLPITSGSTTFAETVILFANIDSEILFSESVSQADVSPNGNHLVWTEESNGWVEVWTRSIDREDSRLIHRQSLLSSPSVSWKSNNVIQVNSSAPTKFISPEGDIINDENSSTNLEIKKQNTQSVIFRGDKSLARLPLGDYTISENHQSFIVVEDSSSSRIALIDTNDNDSPLMLFEEAIDWQWLGAQTLLYADPYGIHLFDTSDSSTETIIRLSKPIIETLWARVHPGYVFYATETNVFAIEIDARDGHRKTQLTDVDQVYGFGLDSRGKSLIFAGKNGFDTGWFTRPLFTRSLPENDDLQDLEI